MNPTAACPFKSQKGDAVKHSSPSSSKDSHPKQKTTARRHVCVQNSRATDAMSACLRRRPILTPHVYCGSSTRYCIESRSSSAYPAPSTCVVLEQKKTTPHSCPENRNGMTTCPSSLSAVFSNTCHKTTAQLECLLPFFCCCEFRSFEKSCMISYV